ncbi:hypothetical protein C8Q79DRAFT_993167 [Trametes meyenii]|nr:hypothetical protein C8Q79DRAFT_993167 [Trametes meyenii]
MPPNPLLCSPKRPRLLCLLASCAAVVGSRTAPSAHFRPRLLCNAFVVALCATCHSTAPHVASRSSFCDTNSRPQRSGGLVRLSVFVLNCIPL